MLYSRGVFFVNIMNKYTRIISNELYIVQVSNWPAICPLSYGMAMAICFTRLGGPGKILRQPMKSLGINFL